MVVNKEDNTVMLIHDNKKLSIYFSDSGDLYWNIDDMQNNNKYICFEITKENYFVYEIFESLYYDVINRNIYHVDEDDIKKCRRYKELIELYQKIKEKNNSYDLKNKYNRLVNDGVINWISNDKYIGNSNVLRIIKVDDTIFLEFVIMNNNYNFIKFNNNRNCYKPFNMCFMKHFRNLYNYDFSNPQIHIEEWLYQQKKLKKQ